MKERKKYESGTAVQYITRKKACKKLQLSLADFRRLCILKGVYPHEPTNRKKASRGSSKYRTLYFKKDIQFLLHEPIINKFRQNKTFLKRLAKAKGREDRREYNHLTRAKPIYKLDHIVRERYPTFIDALRDIDDALCMCNLYASLPKQFGIDPETTHLCRKLSVEFMQYVITARCLRKAFISIKGYYFQAEIMAQTVTWLVPHSFPYSNFDDVDYRVMSTFTHFYSVMLGFVLYRLYQSINLHYPPRIALLSAVDTTAGSDEDKSLSKQKFCTDNDKRMEVVASLNVPLAKHETKTEEDEKDEDVEHLQEEMTPEAVEAIQKRKEEEKFTKLFEGCKFFLSREVPKENLVFVIRSFGGIVSWDSSLGLGSTFAADDETITHQIVDRPTVEKTYISRYYIQPQWVFDCVNARLLLPLSGYLPGDTLPPHLSPFVSDEDGLYIPPERQRVLALQRGEDPGVHNQDENLSESDDDDDDDQSEDDGFEELDEDAGDDLVDKNKEKNDAEIHPVEKKQPPRRPVIRAGKTDVDHQQLPESVAAEEKKLAIMMIPKKRRRLFNKATYRIKRQNREAAALAQKRKLIDEEVRKEKRIEKKTKLKAV